MFMIETDFISFPSFCNLVLLSGQTKLIGSAEREPGRVSGCP